MMIGMIRFDRPAMRIETSDPKNGATGRKADPARGCETEANTREGAGADCGRHGSKIGEADPGPPPNRRDHRQQGFDLAAVQNQALAGEQVSVRDGNYSDREGGATRIEHQKGRHGIPFRPRPGWQRGDSDAITQADPRFTRGRRVACKGNCRMSLVRITPDLYSVDIALAYATVNNVTGKAIYAQADCYLQADAAEALRRAVALAAPLGYRFRIFDAFRPPEAQWALWNFAPDSDFVADPRKGSPHSRGVAIDLTLIDQDGRELDMGTPFDDFTERSHHARTDISLEAQRNRLLLLGLMSAAGWDFYSKEWWHYQLFNARRYPLLSDSLLPRRMMPQG